jgi:uncharacterized membrane protein YeaQ/YmgE (transglycosylase-associated protein family)
MENEMNGTQITNTLTPIVGFIAGILAAKFTVFDTVTWTSILMGIVGLAATIWGAFSTRNTAVVAQAAALPEVKTIIAAPATAAAIPSADVVSSETNKVVAK